MPYCITYWNNRLKVGFGMSPSNAEGDKKFNTLKEARKFIKDYKPIGKWKFIVIQKIKDFEQTTPILSERWIEL